MVSAYHSGYVKEADVSDDHALPSYNVEVVVDSKCYCSELTLTKAASPFSNANDDKAFVGGTPATLTFSQPTW